MLSPDDQTAFLLTIRLAAVTTVLLIVICTPAAWWLAHSRWRYKNWVAALLALPLVLPPTVLGFYLLTVLAPAGPIGSVLSKAGLPALAFSFPGLVIGSFVYSLPFVIQPLQNAFSTIGLRPLEVAATLGAGPWDRFITVVLPLAAPGYLTAAILGFAHTLGEFGVVLMIGGNIPGETKVLSIAIYDHVESLNYAQAHVLSGILLLFSFTVLVLVYRGDRNPRAFIRHD